MDAIVRPQLTPTQVTQVTQYLNIGTVVLLPQQKVLEKIWEWGSGPPLLGQFPVLPPQAAGGIEMPRGVCGKGEGGRPITSHQSQS